MKLPFLTKVLLVLLQLGIGWHLFYEGLWKFQNPSWSSKGYLHNATGPTGLTLRWLAGDPDVAWSNGRLDEVDPTPDLLARLTPIPPTTASTQTWWKGPGAHEHLPEPIKKQWEAYFDSFVDHYELQGQALDIARARFTELEDEMVEWLVEGNKGVKRPHFGGPAGEVEVPIPARLKEYLAWRQAAQNLTPEEAGVFHVANTPRTLKARNEANAIRAELLTALDNQYDLMKKWLRDPGKQLLTPEQRRMALPSEPVVETKGWEMLPWIDTTVKWALLVIGVGLLLGLLSRTACVAGAVLLLLFYIAMPPLVPTEGPQGHFLLVNQNLIEVLALLTLATTQPGQRYGLDAWLGGMWRAIFGERPRAAEPKKVAPAAPPLTVVAAPSPTDADVPVPVSTPAYTPTNRS
jgi:uncharacterized membrane protein YphA (DoxX/SURF4 family)